MPTQCSGERSDAGRVGGRQVAIDFDGGQISSDAGALSLRDVDGTLRLTEQVAACFQYGRDPDLIEHSVRTLVMRRIVAIALGHEGLNDHDPPRAHLQRQTPMRDDNPAHTPFKSVANQPRRLGCEKYGASPAPSYRSPLQRS